MKKRPEKIYINPPQKYDYRFLKNFLLGLLILFLSLILGIIIWLYIGMKTYARTPVDYYFSGRICNSDYTDKELKESMASHIKHGISKKKFKKIIDKNLKKDQERSDFYKNQNEEFFHNNQVDLKTDYYLNEKCIEFEKRMLKIIEEL